MYVYLKCNATPQHRGIFFLMFALLELDVVPMKFTLLSGMLYVGQHKHALPTSVDTHFPESNAPGDAALSPRLWGFTLNSKELRPAFTAEPHGHFNKKDYLAPGTILQPTASPEGAEESAGEKRRRGATDNRADTSPLLWKPFPARGTWETQRVSAVPPATDLRAGPAHPFTEDMARPPDPSSGARVVPAPPARDPECGPDSRPPHAV